MQKKKSVVGGGVRLGSSRRGRDQGGCERRIEVIVRMKNKKVEGPRPVGRRRSGMGLWVWSGRSGLLVARFR